MVIKWCCHPFFFFFPFFFSFSFFLGVIIQLHIVEESGPLRGSTCWQSDHETVSANSADKTCAYKISLCWDTSPEGFSWQCPVTCYQHACLLFSGRGSEAKVRLRLGWLVWIIPKISFCISTLHTDIITLKSNVNHQSCSFIKDVWQTAN